MRKSSVLSVLWGLLIIAQSAQAELIFSAPPRETEERAKEIYEPFAEGLSETLGTKVVYEYPNNFLNYGNRMRAGDFDIVFDAGHFVSWRVEHTDHKVIAKLPGSLFFYVVTLSEDINSTEDLISRKVCTPSPPNLGAVTLLSQFKNPVRQPMLISVEGGFLGAAKSMKKGKCEAAVLRNNVYKNKISDEDRSKFRIVYKSRPIPNQAITAGPNISDSDRAKLAAALTTNKGAMFAGKLLNRFAKKSNHFEKSTGEEYTYLSLLLEGVVWGW
jgi:ABC-type phosphate/phosphonate transport system substrate-binding protein